MAKNLIPFQEEEIREALQKYLGDDYKTDNALTHSKSSGTWTYFINNRDCIKLHDSFVPQFVRIELMLNNKNTRDSYKTYDFHRKITF